VPALILALPALAVGAAVLIGAARAILVRSLSTTLKSLAAL